MKIKKLALYFLLFITAVSCVSKKKILYLQGAPGASNSSISNYEPVIQPDDVLFIAISSQNPEAVEAFNLSAGSGNPDVKSGSYLVSRDGNIEFPILGTLKAAGLTRQEFTDMLRNRLRAYVSDPIIQLRFTNFKVTMLGEVKSPGQVEVQGDRLTLLEAIAQSGDLTLYGMRDNILIVRETGGEKSFNRVDITQADFVNSPFYYLKQNDVVYVQPRRAKFDSTAVGSNIGTIMSIFGFLLSTTFILIARF